MPTLKLSFSRVLANSYRKKALYIVLAVAVAVNVWFYYNLPEMLPFIDTAPKVELVLDKIYYEKYKFLYTDEFEKKIGSWKMFSPRSLDEKCMSFFKFLDDRNPDWTFDAYKGAPYLKEIDNEKKFIDEHKKKRDLKREGSDKDEGRARDAFKKAVDETMELDQKVADSVSIIRIFGHCFYTRNHETNVGEMKDIYTRYSAKIMPYFSHEVPLSSSGDIETNDEWPFDKTGQVENGNLLDYYHKNIQGTGIAISAGDGQTRDLIRLIHLLRALENTLPIQILHRGDLLESNRKALLLAASAPKEELLGPEMTDDEVLKRAFDHAKLDIAELSLYAFPVQKLTIVDLKAPLAGLRGGEFLGFYNKLLAVFFNSFEKMLLFDADTVPLLSPDALLQITEFTGTGALFFRDRTIPIVRPWPESNSFARLMPHKLSALDLAMGIKPVGDKTMQNAIMRGWRHCQESGIVMLDRKKHFRALIMLLPLAIWEHPVKSQTWGDKEMYWLAMSMAGDEEYSFDKYGAATVGELTMGRDKKIYPESRANQLCLSHVAHLSEEGKLLWINGGFEHCKQHTFEQDKSRFPYNLYGGESEISAIYHNPYRIRHALVTPENPTLRGKNSAPHMTMYDQLGADFQDLWRVVDLQPREQQLSDREPIVAFARRNMCSNYEYCAFDIAQSQNMESAGKSVPDGKIFEFDAESCQKYDILGAIWLAARAP